MNERFTLNDEVSTESSDCNGRIVGSIGDLSDIEINALYLIWGSAQFVIDFVVDNEQV
jgi:hypothetical protein